jgi:hypothetical protein
MFKEYEDVESYAKLQGLGGFKKFIKKKTVYLGKEADISNFKREEDIIYVSASEEFLERHAKIHWEEIAGAWYITNLSNEIIYVNKIKVYQNFKQRLSHISAIKMGSLRLYFFQAKEDVIDLT